MYKIVQWLIISLGLALAASPIAVAQSALNIDREKPRVDPEHFRLQDKERQLLAACDELQKADVELQAKIDSLQKKKDDVDSAIRKIQHELNNIHLQLLD